MFCQSSARLSIVTTQEWMISQGAHIKSKWYLKTMQFIGVLLRLTMPPIQMMYSPRQTMRLVNMRVSLSLTIQTTLIPAKALLDPMALLSLGVPKTMAVVI